MASKAPSTKALLKIFWMFDKHGLIKEDLCFDPEHFMETVIREKWNNWNEEKRCYKYELEGRD